MYKVQIYETNMSVKNSKSDSRDRIPLEEYNYLATDVSETSEDMRSSGPQKRLNIKIGKDNEILDKEEQLVGFFSLFRYSSSIEKIVITLASIIAITSGISVPALFVINSKIIDQCIHFSKETSDKNCTVNYTESCSNTTAEFLDLSAQQCMWLLCLGVVNMIFTYLSVTMFHIVATNQAFKIRCMFMASVLKQDVGWYDTNQTGDFAQQITGDLTTIQDGIGDKVAVCLRSISVTVLSIACAIYYGWKLALVTLSCAPVTVCATAIMSQKQAAAARDEVKAYSTAGAIAEEVLSAIRTVVAFGGEKRENERYKRSLLPAMKKGIKRGLITGIGNAFSNSSVFVYYAIGFWYGIHLLLEEWDQEKPTYTPGTIVNVFLNIMIAAVYFGNTAGHFEAFGLARGSACKIFEILDRKPLIDSSSLSGTKPTSVSGKITFEEVHFSYPARPDIPVLQGVSLTIDPDETVALVGPSGCGKSTIIQLLLRFYDADSGTVAVDGNNVKDLNVGWLRDNLSLVGQEPVLFSTTIEANIMHGKPSATFEEVENAAKLANIHDFVQSLPLKYKTQVGERGTQLSGGQKQRVAIARAIIKNPKILLLDEATSALDNESEKVVQAALEEASLGRTTLVVAHRLSTIRHADKIVVLTNGIIQEVGTHSELMNKQGAYYRLVMTQSSDTDNLETLEDTVEDIKGPKEEKEILNFDVCASDEDVNELDQKSAVTIVKKEDEETASPSKIRLLKLSAKEWPYIAIGSISALITGIYLVSVGILFGVVIGIFQDDKSEIEAQYGFFCMLFLVLAITCFVCNFLQVSMFSIAGEKLTCRIRKMIFARIIMQDISFFDYAKNSVGSLCSRMSSDASDIQGAAGSRISTLIQCFSALTTSIFISFWYSYKIALVVLPYIPLATLAFYFENRLTSGLMDSEKSATEQASMIAVEAIGSIRTVASLHQEEAFYTQFKSSLHGPHKKSRLKAHARGFMYSVGQSIETFYCAAALFWGTRLVAHGELLYEDLFKVLEGVMVCLFVAADNISYAPEYQKGKLAAVRIFNLLDQKPKIDAFSNSGKILKDIKGDIQFINVHFNYPNRPDQKVLKGLSFEMEPGKTVALVGSSGCGKSTCVQLIEHFYDVKSGEVVVDGINVKELNVANLRSHIGLVSQEPVLFSCSIADNIAYGDNTRTPDHNEVITAARQANIHNFISSLPEGYDTLAGVKGTLLSCGQKQRIAIARALLRNPRILLLDEATSALDAESEKVVQEALEGARVGRTCLIVAHRLSTIQNADSILVMNQGRMAEKGTHQELLRVKGHYYNLQNVQECPN